MKKQNLLAASYLYLKKDNKVLLQRRQNTGYQDGNYSFVAGHVDEGETYTQAMIREAKEEANIVIEPENMHAVHVMHCILEKVVYVDTYFMADNWSGEVKNLEEEKCDDLSWFDIDNLPPNTIDRVKLAIDSIEKGIAYSEYDGR